MARFFRPEFDMKREFQACRSFIFGGRGFLPGMPVVKQNFTPRRLRQLYDHRYIEFASEAASEPDMALVSGLPGPEEIVPEVARREGLNAPQLGFGLVPRKVERRRLREAAPIVRRKLSKHPE